MTLVTCLLQVNSVQKHIDCAGKHFCAALAHAKASEEKKDLLRGGSRTEVRLIFTLMPYQAGLNGLIDSCTETLFNSISR